MTKLTRLSLVAAATFFAAGVLPAQTSVPAPLKPVATLKLVKAQETKSTTTLPANTRNVGFLVSGGAVHCSLVTLKGADGKTSTWWLNSPFPDKYNSSYGVAKGAAGSFVSVTASCKSTGPTAQIVLSAGR